MYECSVCGPCAAAEAFSARTPILRNRCLSSLKGAHCTKSRIRDGWILLIWDVLKKAKSEADFPKELKSHFPLPFQWWAFQKTRNWPPIRWSFSHFLLCWWLFERPFFGSFQTLTTEKSGLIQFYLKVNSQFCTMVLSMPEDAIVLPSRPLPPL